MLCLMNTPAHALINLLIAGRRDRVDTAVPIVVGSLLPDLPMIAFYAWYRLLGTPEYAIWGHYYPLPGWQAVFDSVHSLPLIALLWLAGLWRGRRWVMWLAVGMALHAVFDLATHHADAHRHFFPLWNWRFHSPVSYWNPAHFGRVASLLEAAASGFATAWLWRRYDSAGLRLMIAALAASYAAHWLFVFATWA